MKKHTWIIVGVLVVLALVASVIYAQKAAKEANEGVVIEDHIKGNPDASVTLTEWSDFECPACGQFYPYLKEIMNDHGDSIRFEYKHFPLVNVHPNAVPAAIASEAAAQQGKFWEMHDKLFENQTIWSRSSSPEAMFVQYADEIGLDVATFKRHMGSTVIRDSVTDSFNEARDLGLNGTPTLFLNGEELEVTSFDQFRTDVEEAIGAIGV